MLRKGGWCSGWGVGAGGHIICHIIELQLPFLTRRNSLLKHGCRGEVSVYSNSCKLGNRHILRAWHHRYMLAPVFGAGNYSSYPVHPGQ